MPMPMALSMTTSPVQAPSSILKADAKSAGHQQHQSLGFTACGEDGLGSSYISTRVHLSPTPAAAAHGDRQTPARESANMQHAPAVQATVLTGLSSAKIGPGVALLMGPSPAQANPPALLLPSPCQPADAASKCSTSNVASAVPELTDSSGVVQQLSQAVDQDGRAEPVADGAGMAQHLDGTMDTAMVDASRLCQLSLQQTVHEAAAANTTEDLALSEQPNYGQQSAAPMQPAEPVHSTEQIQSIEFVTDGAVIPSPGLEQQQQHDGTDASQAPRLSSDSIHALYGQREPGPSGLTLLGIQTAGHQLKPDRPLPQEELSGSSQSGCAVSTMSAAASQYPQLGQGTVISYLSLGQSCCEGTVQLAECHGLSFSQPACERAQPVSEQSTPGNQASLIVNQVSVSAYQLSQAANRPELAHQQRVLAHQITSSAFQLSAAACQLGAPASQLGAPALQLSAAASQLGAPALQQMAPEQHEHLDKAMVDWQGQQPDKSPSRVSSTASEFVKGQCQLAHKGPHHLSPFACAVQMSPILHVATQELLSYCCGMQMSRLCDSDGHCIARNTWYLLVFGQLHSTAVSRQSQQQQQQLSSMDIVNDTMLLAEYTNVTAAP